ncbi:MAG TPA: hypothetical protein VFI65_29130 [Streptosporangiaceae bacterium]|nr:hypothetical protein [Streptosporangiaceae bacterium]
MRRRGRLAGAVIPAPAIAIAGLIVASSGAQATSRHPVRAVLHVGPKVAFGTTTKAEVHASSRVMAVAANQTDLFVEKGLTVTEYL